MQQEGKRDFDAAAAHWDDEPRRLKLAAEIVAAIRMEVPITPGMVALDYGCGSGLVALGLQPHVKWITCADSSRGMLDVVERKVRERGITNLDTMFLDLEQQESLDHRYDLIVSSMTLHHVRDVAALIAALVRSLKHGGWLALADLQTEDGTFHEDPTGVLHGGFDPEFLRRQFIRNGLYDVRALVASTIEKPWKSAGNRSYPVILCIGKK